MKSIGRQSDMLAFILNKRTGFPRFTRRNAVMWTRPWHRGGGGEGNPNMEAWFLKPLFRAPDSSRVCGQPAMQKNRLSLLTHRGATHAKHCFTRLSLVHQRSEEVLRKLRDDGLFCLCPFPDTHTHTHTHTQCSIVASDTATHATIISVSFHLKTVFHKHLLQTLNSVLQVIICREKIMAPVCGCASVRMHASVCVYFCTWRLRAPISQTA